MHTHCPDVLFDKFKTVIDFLRFRGENQSDEIAYTFLRDGETEENNLSYKELELRAKTIAVHLEKIGGLGENILLVYPSGLDFITAFLGCLYAGAVAVPAYPPEPFRMDRTLPRLYAIAKDANPFAILTNSYGLSVSDALVEMSPEFQEIKWIATDRLMVETASEWNSPPIRGDSIAYLQYTSGSTSAPKGVMITHENTLANLALGTQLNGFTPNSLAVGWVPLYHDLGLISYVLGPIYNGFQSILMSPLHFIQNPGRWLKAISRYRATHNAAPPFGYDLCVRKITPEQRKNLDLSCWEVAGVGAETIRPESLNRFAKTFEPYGFHSEAFCPTYGMAESVLYVSGGKNKWGAPFYASSKSGSFQKGKKTVAPDGSNNRNGIASCGGTDIGHQILIVDPVSCMKCDQTQTGEIWLKGPSVAIGYYNKSKESKYCFSAYTSDGEGPFLRTGDMGYMECQELFITGRIKDIIIVRGNNHYPQDIELTVEASHPEIRKGCCAAFGIELADEEHLAIIQELRSDFPKNLDLKKVIHTIKTAIIKEHDIEPGALVLIEPGSIFKTSSGKIQRHECKSAFLEDNLDVLMAWQKKAIPETIADNSIEFTNFKNKMVSLQRANAEKLIQNWLIKKISQILRIQPESLDITALFDSYGLDSLAMAALSGDMEDWLGFLIPPDAAYDYPSIKQLSKELAKLSNPGNEMVLSIEGEK